MAICFVILKKYVSWNGKKMACSKKKRTFVFIHHKHYHPFLYPSLSMRYTYILYNINAGKNQYCLQIMLVSYGNSGKFHGIQMSVSRKNYKHMYLTIFSFKLLQEKSNRFFFFYIILLIWFLRVFSETKRLGGKAKITYVGGCCCSCWR